MQRRGIALVWWVAIVLAIVLIVCLTFLLSPHKVVDDRNTVSSVKPVPVVQTPVASLPALSVMLNGTCTAADCLVTAAKTCVPSNYSWNQTNGGITERKRIELFGSANSSCAIKVYVSQLTYPSNTSKAIINEILSKRGSCSLDPSSFANYLSQAKSSGTFSVTASQACPSLIGKFA